MNQLYTSQAASVESRTFARPRAGVCRAESLSRPTVMVSARDRSRPSRSQAPERYIR